MNFFNIASASYGCVRLLSIALVSSLLIQTSSYAQTAEEQVKTVGGTLKVISAASSSEQRLQLNGKLVSGVADSFLTIKKVYRVAGNDVVLVKSNCAGTACSFSTLTLVTISPSGKVLVSDGMYADEDGSANIETVGEKLNVSIETMDGRRKKTDRWVYANGQLGKTK